MLAIVIVAAVVFVALFVVIVVFAALRDSARREEAWQESVRKATKDAENHTRRAS